MKKKPRKTGKIITECWKEIATKRDEKKSREKEKENYYNRKLMEVQEVEEMRAEGKEVAEELEQIDRMEQRQE